MKKKYYSNSQEYINRWVISYADFITMLLAFFMVMYALSQMDIIHLKNFQKSLEKSLKQESLTIKNLQQAVIANKKEEKKKVQIFTTLKKLKNVELFINKDAVQFDNIEKLIKSDKELLTKVQVSREPRGLIIRLNDAVLFDEGSAIIKNNARLTLDKLTAVLCKIPNSIRIEGHTDDVPINTGKYPSNWELSTARATKIISYLIEKGFNPQSLSVVGYGEYKPIKQNNSPENRASNRRVDVVVLSSMSKIFDPQNIELKEKKLEK